MKVGIRFYNDYEYQLLNTQSGDVIGTIWVQGRGKKWRGKATLPNIKEHRYGAITREDEGAFPNVSGYGAALDPGKSNFILAYQPSTTPDMAFVEAIKATAANLRARGDDVEVLPSYKSVGLDVRSQELKDIINAPYGGASANMPDEDYHYETRVIRASLRPVATDKAHQWHHDNKSYDSKEAAEDRVKELRAQGFEARVKPSKTRLEMDPERFGEEHTFLVQRYTNKYDVIKRRATKPTTSGTVTIREVPDNSTNRSTKNTLPFFRINRHSSRGPQGRDLGADIVRDRRGRHLRL